MADLRITVGTVVDEKLSTPNARAQVELAAFARKLGAGPDDTAVEQAQRILRHFARQIRNGARAQLETEAVQTAQVDFEEANPPLEDWT